MATVGCDGESGHGRVFQIGKRFQHGKLIVAEVCLDKRELLERRLVADVREPAPGDAVADEGQGFELWQALQMNQAGVCDFRAYDFQRPQPRKVF